MSKHQPYDLKQMQSLPLEAKIRMTKARIKVWYESWARFEIYNKKTGKTRFVTMDIRDQFAEPTLKDGEFIKTVQDGQVYVSFSGGKDSTVLADLVARVCKQYGYKMYLLFVNTGLEYPEIQKFVKQFAEWLRITYKIEVQLDIVRPEMRFDEVIKKYGYPVISKEIADCIKGARSGSKTRIERLNGTKKTKDGSPSSFNCSKWKFMLEAPYNVAPDCCNVMKKKPAKHYEKSTGRYPIIGMLAEESFKRRSAWMKTGCNAFDKKRPQSQPMAFWTEQDVLHYIKKFDVPYCSVYGDIVSVDEDGNEYELTEEDVRIFGMFGVMAPLKTTGCERTGCVFCMFGCHMENEPNRFQKLKETHPRQYEYCINGGEMVDGKWQPNKEGLGLGKVLDYIGVKYD